MKTLITKSMGLILALTFSVSVSISQTNSGILAGMKSDKVVVSNQNPSPSSFLGYSSESSVQSRTMTLINFDDIIPAPPFFANTDPCRYHYLGYNITFFGPGPDDGGAILDESSSFGVTGYSPPNFLAFNTGSVMQNGGIPQGPEMIYFQETVAYVSILAGSSNAGTITMTAFDRDDNVIGDTQITGTDNLQLMSISAENIYRVRISFTGNWLVLDDLMYDTYVAPQNLELIPTAMDDNFDLDWEYAPVNGFHEDFNGYISYNWEYVSGNWTTGMNQLDCSNSDKEVASAFYNYDFGDFDMEVVLSKLSGDDCNAGIFFHGDPSAINATGTWLNSYHLIICASGDWNMVRYDNGTANFIQNWTNSPDLITGLGNYNTIRIVKAAGNIDVYFNGVLQGTYFDNTYNIGKLGLKMYDGTLSGIGSFDYVSAYTVVKDYTFGNISQASQRPQYVAGSMYPDCRNCEQGEYILTNAPEPPLSPYTHDGVTGFNNFNVYRNGTLIDAPSLPHLNNTIPDYGFYGYSVTSQYAEGESMSSNYQVTWWREYPIYTQESYPPGDVLWTAYTSDDYSDFRTYDNFTVTEYITGVSFLGLNLEWVSGWAQCATEDPMIFTISFYEDNGGMPGTMVTSFTEPIFRNETNLLYMNYLMYEYHIDFPDYVDLQNGWISIEGADLNTPDCWFLWSSGYGGDNGAYQYDKTNSSFNPLGSDMAFILKGGWVPPGPSNLTAMLDNLSGNVNLNWQFAPVDGKAFLHFRIYRDGTYIGISNSNNYTDALSAFGNYTYHVTALYDEGESDPTNDADVNWQAIPPSNLVANLNTTTGMVNLTWNHNTKGNRAFQHFNIYRDGSIIGTSSSLSYNDNLPSQGVYDYYVTAEYNEGESSPSNTESIDWTGISELNGSVVSIYPNPADEKLIIESGAALEEVGIYNLFGQEVLHNTVSGNKLILNTSTLSEGVYFIKLQSGVDVLVSKVVIR